MSYQEKKAITTLITSILIFGFYAIYVYSKQLDGSYDLINDMSQWGTIFLILIPISIGAHIVVQFIFHFIYSINAEDKDFDITDERDKLIELKSTRNSHFVFIIGFMASMVVLALEFPIYTMFLTLIGAGFLSTIVADITLFYHYRKGV